jgi:hypothetical protein
MNLKDVQGSTELRSETGTFEYETKLLTTHQTAKFHHPPFCFSTVIRCGSRNSVVGIATGYGLDDQGVGVRVPVG